MPISFACDCGRILRTTDENAGRSATCPKCGVQLLVPEADAPAPRRPAAPPVEESRGYDLAGEEVVPAGRRPDAPYNRPRRDDRDDDAPRRSDRPRYGDVNRFAKPAPTRYGGGMTDKGAVAGILMMVGAVIWFVVGMAVNVIFFYPPILFILGLICFIKGLTNRS